MSTWRMAKSLEVLRRELNGVYPDRDKTADGGVGDTAHQARPSKHNPGPDGIVEARDFDEDVSGRNGQGGRPLWPFVLHLLRLAKAGHPALGPGAHIIYEGRIWSHARGWSERAYTGQNAHAHHAHVAVSDGPGKDSEKTWNIAALLAAKPSTSPKPDRWLGLSNPAMTGADVNNVRNALRVAGNKLAATGPYDRQVADLIAAFQQRRGITERGVGPLTWMALRKMAH